MAEYYKISGERLTGIADQARRLAGTTVPLNPAQIQETLGTLNAATAPPAWLGGIAESVMDLRSRFNSFVAESVECSYNGTILPAIPPDVLASYPYIYMIRNDRFSAFSVKPYFYSTASYPSTLKADGGGVTYELNENGNDWKLRENHNSIYIIITGVLWSNYDIPNGSANATEIYFDGSCAIPQFREG